MYPVTIQRIIAFWNPEVKFVDDLLRGNSDTVKGCYDKTDADVADAVFSIQSIGTITRGSTRERAISPRLRMSIFFRPYRVRCPLLIIGDSGIMPLAYWPYA